MSTPPALSPNDLLPPHAVMVRGTCSGVISAVLGDAVTQRSMLRYRGELNLKLATGQTLTSDERVDSDLMTAIDAWEASCVEVREKAATDVTPLGTIAWPAPPEGVTTEWLRGF